MHRLAIAAFGTGLFATAAMAQPAPVTTAPPPAAHEVIYQATSILGRKVRDPGGTPIGRIVDVLVDETGTPRAAVIDFGGFMGVGNRRVAVAWHALRFVTTAGQQSITLDMTEDQISATPDFKRPATPSDPPVTVAVPPKTVVPSSVSIAPPVAPVAKP